MTINFCNRLKTFYFLNYKFIFSFNTLLTTYLIKEPPSFALFYRESTYLYIFLFFDSFIYVEPNFFTLVKHTYIIKHNSLVNLSHLSNYRKFF